MARAHASTTAYYEALIIPLHSMAVDSGATGSGRCVLAKGFRQRRILLLMTAMSGNAQSWASMRMKQSRPIGGELSTWARIVRSLNSSLLPLLWRSRTSIAFDGQATLLEYMRVLLHLSQGLAANKSGVLEVDGADEASCDLDVIGADLRASIWSALVSILAQARVVQVSEDTLRAFSGSYSDRLSLAAVMSSALSFSSAAHDDSGKRCDVVPVSKVLLIIESLCARVKGRESNGDEGEGKKDTNLALLLAISLLGCSSPVAKDETATDSKKNVTPAEFIITCATSAPTSADKEKLLHVAHDLIADRLYSFVTYINRGNEENLEGVISEHLNAWAAVVAQVPTATRLPLQITAAVSMLLHAHNWKALHSLLACASPIVRVATQPDALTTGQGRAGCSLLAAVLPPVLLSFSTAEMHSNSTNANVSASEQASVQALLDCLLLQAQLLFLSFTASASAPDESDGNGRTEAALESLLPVLSARLLLLDRDRDSLTRTGGPGVTVRLAHVESFIGKGLVQVAKLHAQIFRTTVGELAEGKRSRLQLCMQQALQIDAAGTGPQGNVGRHTASSLKIDVSKFGR